VADADAVYTDVWASMGQEEEAAERAKIELSTTQSTEVNLPFITADAEGPKHLTITLTRAKLEQLTDEIMKMTI